MGMRQMDWLMFLSKTYKSSYGTPRRVPWALCLAGVMPNAAGGAETWQVAARRLHRRFRNHLFWHW